MMKKLRKVHLALTGTLVLSLAACGGGGSPSPGQTSQGAAPVTQAKRKISKVQ